MGCVVIGKIHLLDCSKPAHGNVELIVALTKFSGRSSTRGNGHELGRCLLVSAKGNKLPLQPPQNGHAELVLELPGLQHPTAT